MGSSARHEIVVKSAHEARHLYRFGSAAPLRSRTCPGALERNASCCLVAVPPPRGRAQKPLQGSVMRILMVTDAWRPQVNGVVHTLERLTETLKSFDVQVEFLTPNIFRTLPLPTYPDIRLALTTPGHVARLIDARKADHIHLLTEG